MITVGDLAAQLSLPLGDADPGVALQGIAPLPTAGPADLAFVSERRYLPALASSRAGCVLLRSEWRAQSPVPALCTDQPYLYYARASALFDRAPQPVAGVHATAAVDPAAQLGEGVSVGPGACIEAGARLGDGVVVGAGAFVGGGAAVGDGSRLYPNVVLYHGVVLGRGCAVHANTVIGADGFGYARGPGGWEKIHQLGSVRIGDGVEIGASVTIDRGALGDTVIEDGVIIDDQVHIAHNCRIGERTAIAGCVGFAGSTEVGRDCAFAGQVGVSGHLRICDNATFTGQARVTRSIEEPGSYSSGTPLEASRQWGRNAVRFTQLDALARRVAALESQLGDASVSAGAGMNTGAKDRSDADNEE